MALEPGTRIADKYSLLARLGAGALGEVWVARNEVVEREVALKLLAPAWTLDDAAVDQFFADAKASGKIRHPSIVELLDLGRTVDRVPYVVMELLEAEKLDTVIERVESLPTGTALRIVAELADALAAAHARGLPHLRIEPANVLLHRGPRGVTVPKLVDFGVARLVHRAPARAKRIDDLLGPLAYLSPEQAQGRPADARADVWALGVLLYHAMVGAPPFAAKTLAELVEAHARPRVAPDVVDPSIDKVASQLVIDCLATAPADRPTASAVARRAEELLRRIDDSWTDLAGVLEIPNERRLARFAAVTTTVRPHGPIPAPAKAMSIAPASRSTPGVEDALQALAAEVGKSLTSGGGEEPERVSSSALEEAPPSSEIVPSSSELQEVPPPSSREPLSSADVLSSEDAPAPGAQRPRSVAPPTPAAAVPLVRRTATLRPIRHEPAPVSALIAARLSQGGGDDSIGALDDLEAALLARVEADRRVAAPEPPVSLSAEGDDALRDDVETPIAPPPAEGLFSVRPPAPPKGVEAAAAAPIPKSDANDMKTAPSMRVARPPSGKALVPIVLVGLAAVVLAIAFALPHRDAPATPSAPPAPTVEITLEPAPSTLASSSSSAPTPVASSALSAAASSSAPPVALASTVATAPAPPIASATSAPIPTTTATTIATATATATTTTTTAPTETATAATPPEPKPKPKVAGSTKPPADPFYGVHDPGI